MAELYVLITNKMKETIYKILSGRASQKERDRFFKEIESNHELADEYAKAKCDYVFDNLPYSQEGLHTGTAAPEKKITFHRIANTLTRIAAVIAIPLFIYFIYDRYCSEADAGIPADETPDIARIVAANSVTPTIKYSTRTGIIGKVLLPDSSVVHLNSGSSIEFPVEFDSEQRIINFCGEGFFEIRSDKNKPMKINTSNGVSVIITGTKFNLSNYSNDSRMKLALADGAVSIYRSNTNSVINVYENDEIVINKTKDGTSSAYRIKNSDINYITSWMREILKFRNTPMTEVIEKLNNWYGYHIVIKNDKIKDYRFTGEFQSESLINILEAIRISSNIRYSIVKKEVSLY